MTFGQLCPEGDKCIDGTLNALWLWHRHAVNGSGVWTLGSGAGDGADAARAVVGPC